MDFEKILDKILNKLNEYQVRGSFVFDIDNLENIDKVNDIIEEVLKEEGYYDKIKDYRKVFDDNLADIISQYKSFGTINTRSLKAFNNVAFDNFYNNLAVNVTDTNIKQPIKDALLQYVAGGGKYNDFKSTVKDILTTKKIQGNIDIVAREYSTQYKRAQGQILANKFNVQYLANITIDTLVLEDEMGNSTMLSKITPTTFSSSDFLGVEGRLYRLKLFYYGNVYEDFGTMPYADSLTNFSVNVNLKINF